MPCVLTSQMVGRRVVVRRALGPDNGPPFRDTLGDLIALDDDAAAVETRSGVVLVPMKEVVLARLVQPSAADQLALEAVAARGWQAGTVEVSTDGWLLRADAGWTSRANSVLALRTPRRPLTEALAEVDAFYARHRLPTCIAVPRPAGAALDSALARLGWREHSAADVLVTRLDLFQDRTGSTGPSVAAGEVAAGQADVGRLVGYDLEVATEPSPQWLRAGRYRGGSLPDGAAALLRRHDRAFFASIHDRSNVPVAVARGVVDDDWLGVTVLAVDEAHRRRGLGTALLRTLAQRAVTAGATRAYLQVGTDNGTAAQMYASLGWHRHHSYVYLVR